jgi:hypothetical protein
MKSSVALLPSALIAVSPVLISCAQTGTTSTTSPSTSSIAFKTTLAPMSTPAAETPHTGAFPSLSPPQAWCNSTKL